MAHSQKSIRDHARNRTHPNIDNKVISQQIEELVKPCVYNQLAYYRSLGMRERILSLPLMLAAVLTLVWRQVPSARELRGFWNYRLFEQLIQAQSDFITRLKSNAKYESISILSQSSTHRDTLVRLGTGYQGNPILNLRLVEIRHGRSCIDILLLYLTPIFYLLLLLAISTPVVGESKKVFFCSNDC